MSLDDGYDRKPALVTLDVLGDPEQLPVATSGEATAATVGGGLDASLEGRDETGVVTVAVDRQGRVVDVVVSRWWREDLEPSALGPALFAAYTAATGKAVTAMYAAGDDGVPGQSSRGPEMWPADAADSAFFAGGDDRWWLREVENRLARVGWELDRIQRMREDAATRAEQERIACGPHGYVRVTARGPEIVGVEVDAEGVVEARPERLAADALEAFRAAR